MHSIGIIAEYNPFHNGHAYLIEKAKQESNAPVVVIMSGDLMQRGEFPLFPASVRTKAALLCGADLVVELPAPYAMQSAEGFAFASVYLLKSLGIINTLYFGAETPDVALFQETASILLGNTYPPLLKQHLQTGVSFPTARQLALEALTPETVPLVSTPNNLLGVEYCKAINTLKWPIQINPVARLGTTHDSDVATAHFSSASALRKLVLKKEFRFETDFAPFVPTVTHDLYQDAFQKGNFHIPNKKLDTALLSILRTKQKQDFSTTLGESEGLHNLLYTSVQQATSLTQLYTLLKSKRYTHSRVRRFVFAAALGFENSLPKIPPYLHLLGATEKGLALLKSAKQTATLPLSHSLSALSNANEDATQVAKYATTASNLYSLLLKTPQAAGTGFTTPFIKLK